MDNLRFRDFWNCCENIRYNKKSISFLSPNNKLWIYYPIINNTINDEVVYPQWELLVAKMTKDVNLYKKESWDSRSKLILSFHFNFERNLVDVIKNDKSYDERVPYEDKIVSFSIDGKLNGNWMDFIVNSKSRIQNKYAGDIVKDIILHFTSSYEFIENIEEDSTNKDEINHFESFIKNKFVCEFKKLHPEISDELIESEWNKISDVIISLCHEIINKGES